MSDLYKRIEELGKKQGYKNITKLCAAAGVPRAVMSELNAGRSKDLSKLNAEKFAKCLNTTLDVIYGINDEKPTISEDDELNEYLDLLRTRPECRMFLDTIKGATKEEVEENVRFIEALRKAKG